MHLARPEKSNGQSGEFQALARAATGGRPAKPSREEAEAAVRTLIRWAGDDPDREGLRATPSRVVRAYEEWFSGYKDEPREYLKRTFEETGGYDEVVVLRDIRFESYCEHHMAPIIGRVHIGYLPRNRVVGISKLARLVEVYARRLQIQEKMTAEDRGLPRRRAQAARRRRGHRGHAPMHDHARRAQARRHHGDEPHARRVPRSRRDPAGISVRDRHARRRLRSDQRASGIAG